MFRLAEVATAVTLRRPCWKKVAHPSQGAAAAHVRSLLRRDRAKNPTALNTYRCRHCDLWHVGHRREDHL